MWIPVKSLQYWLTASDFIVLSVVHWLSCAVEAYTTAELLISESDTDSQRYCDPDIWKN